MGNGWEIFGFGGRGRMNIPPHVWKRYWAFRECGLSDKAATTLAWAGGDKNYNRNQRQAAIDYLKHSGQCWLGIFIDKCTASPEQMEDSYKLDDE